MFKKFFNHHDIYLTGLLIGLLLIGLITLFSTTRGTGLENEALFPKQLIFVIIGLIFYFTISFINLDWLKSKFVQTSLYIILLILLIAVLLFTAKVKGAQRWFVIPMPLVGSLNFQPADIAKLIIIIVGSFILTQWKNFSKNTFSRSKYLKNEIVPYVISMFPILALILIQPALGTTIISFSCLMFMYYFAEKDKSKIFGYIFSIIATLFIWIFFKNLDVYVRLGISIAVVVISSLLIFRKSNKIIIIAILIFANLVTFSLAKTNNINFLGEYQKDRVECWLMPENDPMGKCFQQIQARIAIGSGQLFGRGFSQGLQVQRDQLPEFQNDFIYAAFAEQYGFIGTVVLLFIFFLFIAELIRLSTSQKSEFSRIVIMGIAVMFLLQVFINIAMNNGLLPTTGISLPFMSYGGSFMWVALISVGIVQNLSHNKVLEDHETKKYERWDEDYS